MPVEVDVNGSGAATLESFCRACQGIDGSGVRGETYRFALFANHGCRGFRTSSQLEGHECGGEMTSRLVSWRERALHCRSSRSVLCTPVTSG